MLSLTEPIYTQCGRYGGGIYVIDGYYSDRNYLNNNEIELLNKVTNIINNRSKDSLSLEELSLLNSIITKYKKPGD